MVSYGAAVNVSSGIWSGSFDMTRVRVDRVFAVRTFSILLHHACCRFVLLLAFYPVLRSVTLCSFSKSCTKSLCS